MNAIVHEFRKQLAIAVANVEAFIDGKLEATPRRLRSVSDALSRIDGLLVELTERSSTTVPEEEWILELCTIVRNEVVALASANADAGPEWVGQVLHDLLLNAIRHTAPGGAIVVECHRESESFAFSVSNAGTESHDGAAVRGGSITIVRNPNNAATFTVRLLDASPPSERTFKSVEVSQLAVTSNRIVFARDREIGRSS